MHFVYIIKCEDNTLYTGITDDVKRRFLEHHNGKGGRYTKLHKGVKFLYQEKFKTKGEAARREKQIKGWRREKKLNLIKFGKPTILF